MASPKRTIVRIFGFFGGRVSVVCEGFFIYYCYNYAPQRAGHASLPGPAAPLLTELLQLPVPGYGTVYRHISEMLTYRTVGFGGH